ncbi:MAG: hypothetical protein WDZ47_00990 [Bacteroidales bacterium]
MTERSTRLMRYTADKWNRSIRKMVSRNRAFYDKLAAMDEGKDSD